jgi:hypothetical protein
MTLTLPKLLLLALICWLVWMFLRKSNIIGGSKAAKSAPNAERPKERAIEDMVQCPTCGAYVPALGGHDCRDVEPRR